MTQATKRQIEAAMKANSIPGELSGRGENWEVQLADDKTMRKFCRTVANVGGYKTGYGAWVLRPGYTSNGDWNDRTSRHHY
jgi:hypothetical protein